MDGGEREYWPDGLPEYDDEIDSVVEHKLVRKIDLRIVRASSLPLSIIS